MKILVSACLLGLHCRYDGKDNARAQVLDLAKEHELIPACAEQLGGLPTPRYPVEWCQGKAINSKGADCTKEFERGAKEVLRLARTLGCQLAILKAKSPSCGNKEIYDGSFSGKKIPGMGETARLLQEQGIPVINETEIAAFFNKTGGIDS